MTRPIPATQHEPCEPGVPHTRWCIGSPFPVGFGAPRLVVRPFRIDEASMLFATINTSRSHLAPWVPWAIDGHRTLAQTTAYIVEQAMAIERASNDPERFRGIGLGVFERATGRLVGGTGIHDVQPAAWSCETGYWMRRESCGLGYATEVCAATISWALRPVEKLGLGLQRVRAICSSANTASVRVLDKLGLPRELCQRREYHLPGIGLTDRLGYGVHVDEWDTERHTMR